MKVVIHLAYMIFSTLPNITEAFSATSDMHLPVSDLTLTLQLTSAHSVHLATDVAVAELVAGSNIDM